MITHQHPAALAVYTASGGLQSVPPATWVHGLTAALPHLTADDLRNTHAGRALMAEAWEEGALHQARGSAETRRVLASALPNPYKEAPNE